MKKIIILLFCVLVISLSAYQAEVKFTDSWDKQGFSIEEQNNRELRLNYSITEFYFEDILIDNENLTNIQLPGVFLPNDEGMPNLPGIGRYIAIPQGAKAELHIIDYRIERYSDINIVPAPRIPLDTETGPLEYIRNMDIYSMNANYPENFIQLSEPSKLRGVDVVMLGITPFQYNPVNKELIVYRDIKLKVSFSGGNGHFGEDRLRNRWWDSIIENAILNQNVLPEIDYNLKNLTRDGAEYLIICPDDATFITWANTIKNFRQQQGISTMIVTTTEVGGNTTSAIETYVDNAYNNWDTPPIAVLLLGDYGSSGNTVMSSADFSHPYQGTYISDNVFADVDGDDLPEIAFARMTAQNSTHLANMINKFINYENQPPTNSNFYNEPITALGWQDDRWFQICSETIGGFFNNELGKSSVRINALGSPANNYNSGPWSTATNTSTVVNYFGPSGLGYIPATPQETGGFTGGGATDVNNAINSGAFMLQHRDHGGESGWGEPYYRTSNLSGIGNNDPVFVMSINCLTGRFDYGSEVFTEAFHRMEYGALGLIAASQVSYSFVNDAYVWGLYDYMWPEFDPGYGSAGDINILPCFGNASAKYYLQASSWPSNPSSKQITYRLFHHHGDAFSTVYSEVPQNLTVSHAATLLAQITLFSVTADNGSFVALTVNNEIIGTADGTGSAVDISIPAQNGDYDMLVTITKQNYFRYSSIVDIISLIPDITVNPTTFSESLGLDATLQRTLSISNDGQSGSILNYNIIIEESSRNISGSTFTSTETDYEPDTTFDLHLTIYNASIDDEWLDEATLDFPTGVIVNSSTNFVGGTDGDLVSDGSTGNGITIVWSDNNGDWGNIHGGESANATVNITVDSGFSGDMNNDWTLSGDVYGSTPHDISGTLTLSQASANLTLTSPNGSEVWANGESNNITWTHSGAALANVKLELSTNNGTGYSNIIASTTNDGIYEWTVIGSISEECLVRVSDPAVPTTNDISNAVFRIYDTVTWLSIDHDNGSLGQGSTDNLTLTFDTSGLSAGTYNGNIQISSNDPDEATVTVPVSLTVSSASPNSPANVTISISGSDLTINWDAVAGATSYKVYSSDGPYTGFTEDTSGSFTGESWTTSIINEKNFYHITANN